ncbi:hypothetical protein [Ammoniphilus sp. 3BR4]|uniref:hypothetical protein n=1 Tax=Ammoniphilus sp. 3BR4 TaxID=3158265 RepID=UPI0034653B58
MLSVRTATLEDVEDMMKWDYRYYPQEWRVNLESVKQTFRNGTQLARVVETAEGIKGYYAQLPLPKDAYEQILRGELHEGELSEHVLHYDFVKEVYLYSVSFIVDIEDPQKKSYSKALIQDMPHFYSSLTRSGVDIKELGAIVVSKDGKRIAESMGYRHLGETLTHEGKDYPIYRAQLKNILEAIQRHPATAL